MALKSSDGVFVLKLFLDFLHFSQLALFPGGFRYLGNHHIIIRYINGVVA
jgi:hypothetical protein